MTGGTPTRSPWLEQLRAGDPPRPLTADLTTDVLVVGAGIAGASTAFFVLRETDLRVALVERGTTGHGATGHNAGQLATYFERPLHDMVAEFGAERTVDAQRGIDGTWDLIDLMARECGSTQRLDRFAGNMGMFNLDQLLVHLGQSALRRDHGLMVPECLVSERAPFVADIPTEFDGLYEVVPDAQLRALLGDGTERYSAVLRGQIGAANGALLVQQVIDHLVATYPERFLHADHTLVEHLALHADHAVVRAFSAGTPRTVHATRVVLCTNGFVDHEVENLAGEPVDATLHHQLIGTKGYMAGLLEPGLRDPNAYSFIRNEHIGDDEVPYVYVTRRPWDGDRMLVVCGGPEETLEDARTYDADAPFPDDRIAEFEEDVLPLAYPAHRPGDHLHFRWHGLMGYTANRLRVIGPEPRNPVLLYNLGCNGVGFMPSIFGGHRIARLLAGDDLGPSLFDPR